MTDIFQGRKCDICNGESCTEPVGVCSVPGVPMSVLYGNKCLRQEIVMPDFCFTYYFYDVAGGDLSRLHEECRDWLSWIDGKYVTLQQFASTITPEMVEAYFVEQARALQECYDKSNEAFEDYQSFHTEYNKGPDGR